MASDACNVGAFCFSRTQRVASPLFQPNQISAKQHYGLICLGFASTVFTCTGSDALTLNERAIIVQLNKGSVNAKSIFHGRYRDCGRPCFERRDGTFWE